VIEAFLIEYESENKTSVNTKVEQRIIDLGLNIDSNDSSSKESNRTNQTIIGKIREFISSLKKICDLNESRENKLNKIDIENEGTILFHLNSRAPKSVEALLQSMFSNEFDISQEDLIIKD